MTKYIGEFDDIDNNRIRLEIDIDGFSGEAEELIIGDPSITINYSCEDILQPLKKSGASINLVVPNIMTDLFTGELFNPKVRIYKSYTVEEETIEELIWFGYITPNIYSQPYKDRYDLLTLECVDSISNLANMDFQKTDEISSFLDIIKNIISRTNTECTKLYIPTCIAVGNSTDVLSNLYIQQRNFLDEKNEPEKCDVVVGEMLKYLGLQMFQWKDAYYIIEPKDVLMRNTTYLEVDLTNGTKQSATINIPVRDVMDIGIRLGNGTVSLGGVYNKITVVANNNPLSSIIPELDDDGDLVNQNQDPQHFETKSYESEAEQYTLVSAYFNSQNNWTTQPMYKYEGGAATEITEVTDTVFDNGSNNLEGTVFQKVAQYATSDGEPSKLGWETNLSFIRSYPYGGTHAPFISLRNTKSMVFDGGYLLINLKYKLSTELYAHSIVKSKYDNFSTLGYYNKVWSDSVSEIGSSNWPNYTMFQCRLKVGDTFWNGEHWIKQSDYDAKMVRWNTIYINYSGVDAGSQTHYWYRIWNAYDEWEYVTQSQYNTFSGTKESGACPYAHARYTYRYDSGNNVNVWVTDEFYYERYYGNYCWLIRNNKAGDKIMDTVYQLTNTVSYRFKIVNAIDGIAIPIETPLFGNLEFALYEPIDNTILGGNILSRDPQHQQSKGDGTCRAIHISDLVMKYSQTNASQDIFNMTEADPDVKYTNLINSGYCSEFDDVLLKVNTYSDVATSYSYVMTKDNNTYSYLDTLTYHGADRKPEENVLINYATHYGSPKYQYTNTIANDEVTPFSVISEHNLNKTMLVTNASYDLSYNRVEVQLSEL